MTNRKMFLILGIAIIGIGFMGLVLYNSYEEKRAAQEQGQILKEREEARARAEEEKRRGEEERQKAEATRREAELAEKQRIEQQRKFEEEEVERYKQEMDRQAREERRRIEEEQSKNREQERKEKRQKAQLLNNPISAAENEVIYAKQRIEQLQAWKRTIANNYESDKSKAEEFASTGIKGLKEQVLQDAERIRKRDTEGAERQLNELNIHLNKANEKLAELKKQYNELIK